MCCISPDFFEAIMLGSTVNPNINAGSRIVMTMNDFLRTVSRYSRRANRKMLCIGLPHSVDEDIFERWLDQLKLVYARPSGHHLQQFLRIGARSHADLYVVSVVVERLHQSVLVQE